MTLHITEAELVRDVRAVLRSVEQGDEVVIEQDRRPVAIIKSPLRAGCLLSESIALAEARNSTAKLDEGFMKDVKEGIDSRSQPWNPPSWE